MVCRLFLQDQQILSDQERDIIYAIYDVSDFEPTQHNIFNPYRKGFLLRLLDDHHKVTRNCQHYFLPNHIVFCRSIIFIIIMMWTCCFIKLVVKLFRLSLYDFFDNDEKPKNWILKMFYECYSKTHIKYISILNYKHFIFWYS